MNPMNIILQQIFGGGMRQPKRDPNITHETNWFEFYRTKDGIIVPNSADDYEQLGCILVDTPIVDNHEMGCPEEVALTKTFLRTVVTLPDDFEYTGKRFSADVPVPADLKNKLFTDEAEIKSVVETLRKCVDRATIAMAEKQLNETKLLMRRQELMDQLVKEPYGWDGSRLVFERILTDEEIDAVRHDWRFPDGQRGFKGDFHMSNANQHR